MHLAWNATLQPVHSYRGQCVVHSPWYHMQYHPSCQGARGFRPETTTREHQDVGPQDDRQRFVGGRPQVAEHRRSEPLLGRGEGHRLARQRSATTNRPSASVFAWRRGLDRAVPMKPDRPRSTVISAPSMAPPSGSVTRPAIEAPGIRTTVPKSTLPLPSTTRTPGIFAGEKPVARTSRKGGLRRPFCPALFVEFAGFACSL